MRLRGFTLLEVMIALLVVTLGMSAVISVTGDSSWKSAHLRHSTIANWVAYNEIALYRAKRSWPNTRQRSGETEMANAVWEWTMTFTDTPNPSVREVEVEVRLEDEPALKARVKGFVSRL